MQKFLGISVIQALENRCGTPQSNTIRGRVGVRLNRARFFAQSIVPQRTVGQVRYSDQSPTAPRQINLAAAGRLHFLRICAGGIAI